MTKPKQKRELPENVEALTSDEVMRQVFGLTAQKALKREAEESGNREPESDESPTGTT